MPESEAVCQNTPMIRPPAVAGRFYTADARELARQIKDFCPNGKEKIAARGCVVPHAGYMYSGQVAGDVYSALQIPAQCILIGPRHFPRGEAMAILTEGSWQTPFGEAQIDSAWPPPSQKPARCSARTRSRTSASIRSKCSFRFCSD